MLGDISKASGYYIVCGYTDMRKAIDGLAAVIKEQYALDPFNKCLFLFCGKRRDRLKALLWEDLSAHFCYPNHLDKNPCILKFK